MPPERARAIVVGGGVIGCSCLYHLAKQGWTDSVLVEQFQLTHGSTWHSAGLVGQLRSSISLTRMMQYSVGLYAELKDLTGNDPGWHQLGGLRLASSQPRLEEIRRQAAWAKTFGLTMEIVSAADAQRRFPPMSTEGVLAAASSWAATSARRLRGRSTASRRASRRSSSPRSGTGWRSSSRTRSHACPRWRTPR